MRNRDREYIRLLEAMLDGDKVEELRQSIDKKFPSTSEKVKEGSALFAKFRKEKASMTPQQIEEFKESKDWASIKEYNASRMREYRKGTDKPYTPQKTPVDVDKIAEKEGTRIYTKFRKEKANMSPEQIAEFKKSPDWDTYKVSQASRMKKYRDAKKISKKIGKKLPFVGAISSLASGDASAALPMGMESEALNENDPIERRLQLKAEGKREVSYEQKLREMRSQRQEWIKQGVIDRIQGE